MSNPLTIEIHGTGTHNRGAELMATAIADRLRKRYPGVRIAVSPSFGNPLEIDSHGFLTVIDEFSNLSKRFFGALRCCAPPEFYRVARSANRPFLRVRSALGKQPRHVAAAEIDFVLDASGFAYSDQWGASGARFLALKMEADRNCRGLVVLPQALGPFEQPKVREWSSRLLSKAMCSFARDRVSFHYAQQLNLDQTAVHQYPDFTLEVSPRRSADVVLPERFVAVVPNIRMFDKGDEGQAYLWFLQEAIRGLQRRGREPVILLHAAEADWKIVEMLEVQDQGILVLEHADPRVLKWILSEADFVIASRFHALVSSLSSGVASLATGWSHKYQELFADFGCEDYLIKDLRDSSELAMRLDSFCDESELRGVCEAIRVRKQVLQHKVEEMWELVFDCIDTRR